MSEFDAGLPSIRQIQRFIKDKQTVELKVIPNETLVGKLLWQDSQSLCLVDNTEQPIIVWRHALISLKAKK